MTTTRGIRGHTAGSMRFRRTVLVVAAHAMGAGSAMALDTELADGDVKLRWDNSVKYSNAARVSKPSATLTADVNQDDGDRNFARRGIVSNRLDWLTDLDVVYQGDYGVRLSGAAWYDSVYHRDTDHTSPGTSNATSVPASEFTEATRKLHGGKGELLDAFFFAKGMAGDMRWSARAGRHTLLWGETLFFGANGIAGGQAPIDLVKLLSVPGSQFKEVIRPVGQLSGSLQLTPDLQLGGYYQYRWERSRLPGVGSYFSNQDLFDAGGERFFLPFPPFQLVRGEDLAAKDSGQGGVQVRFRLPGDKTDFGAYAIRYHGKDPQLYLNVPVGTHSIAFHEGIRAYGLSASRTLGELNLATEVSVRHNAPLVNDGTVNFTGAAPTAGRPLYPVGKTAHVNLSAIWTVPSTPLANEATLLAEFAWNRRLSVSNGGTLAANSSRDAFGLRFQFVPTYRQLMPGLDLDVPVGVGYNPQGRSQAVSFFNGGMHKGGDLSIGVSANYLNTWKFGISGTHYFGPEGTTLDGAGHLSFKQNLHDRDFVSFNVQTTF